jgi:hypothetical protein
MNFDELQKIWQQVQDGSKLVIEPDILTREVKRNKKAFESLIFGRDALEIITSIFMAGIFFFGAMKFRHNLPLTISLIVIVIACLYLAIFFPIDHALQRRKAPRQSESLSDCIEASLIQVNHQIWLLKNVIWWYLLPCAVPVTLYLTVVYWYKASHDCIAVIMFSVSVLIVILGCWWAYRFNQSAVKKNLTPRKEELEQLLAGLKGNGATVGS